MIVLPALPVPAIVIVVGFVHGFLNVDALKEGSGILGLIRIMATLFEFVALVSAIGMLMFGWLFRGQG